jgi:hypothetical protein
VSYTHRQLVLRAGDWLMAKKRCRPVLLEHKCWSACEQPDAIGFGAGGSIVIECKTSRSDLYADRVKPFRKNPETGMGTFRYYMAAPDVIGVSDVGSWGLLHVTGEKLSRVKLVKVSEEHKSDPASESALVRSAWLWGLGWKHHLPITHSAHPDYDYPKALSALQSLDLPSLPEPTVVRLYECLTADSLPGSFSMGPCDFGEEVSA